MATLYKLPCIFVVENNKWAIGMNHPRATAPSAIGDNDPWIYKKGPAFGMPGVHVDGMDVMKVRGSWRRRPCRPRGAVVGAANRWCVVAAAAGATACVVARLDLQAGPRCGG
jgi:hypothetical protein